MEDLKITRADKPQMQKMMNLIRMLEIVAQCQVDFDPGDHLNEHDELYKPLMRYFNRDNGAFNYRLFVKETGEAIGSGMQLILLGYETLIEKFCDPGATFLQPKRNIADLSDDQLLINATLIGEYKSPEAYFAGLVDHRKMHPVSSVITVSNKGFRLTGLDMLAAGISNFFPVKSYMIIPASEQVQYKSLSNN